MGNIVLWYTRLNSVIYRNYQSQLSKVEWSLWSSSDRITEQLAAWIEAERQELNHPHTVMRLIHLYFQYRTPDLFIYLVNIHAWMSNKDREYNMLKTELLVFPYSLLFPHSSPSQWKSSSFLFLVTKTLNPFLTSCSLPMIIMLVLFENLFRMQPHLTNSKPPFYFTWITEVAF